MQDGITFAFDAGISNLLVTSMLNADQALSIILDAVGPCRREKVRLEDSPGRTIAVDVVVRQPLPPVPNSSMDGYAVRAIDCVGASRDSPKHLALVGESSAGHPMRGTVGNGAAVRIMTGGVLPRGADAVVPVEGTTGESKGRVAVIAPVHEGDHIRRTGEDVRKGETVMSRGMRIGPGQTGLLGALGYATVPVMRLPRVNILATGDEIIPVESRPSRGSIRNSTSYALAAYCREAGSLPKMKGIVRDEPRVLTRRLRSALDCDVLLLTGGVSVGKYDIVKPSLEKAGITIHFWRVNVKPGKPMVFGVFGRTLVFGLPGNPASTAVAFHQFVRPALRAMQSDPHPMPHVIPALMDEDVSKSDGRRHFLRGTARCDGGVVRVRLAGSQSSSAMSSMARANCLIVLPEDALRIGRGEHVDIEPLPFTFSFL
jgi:molybdopterin molybdotransferase